MIKGMTGFGAAQVSAGEVKTIIEIKSVNHRYFDMAYYLPHGFGSIESKIQQMVAKEVERGRVTVSVKIIDKPNQQVSLNQEMVKEYVKHAQVIKKQFGIENDLTASTLLSFPGVISTKEVFVDVVDLWPAIEKGLKGAIKQLVGMRSQEGKSLTKDVLDKNKRMALQIKKIQARLKVILADGKKKMSNEEFTSFQKSVCISEELTRMEHHLKEVKALLKEKVPVGKKLDFIAQEMQRETNTIGSKVQDKVVTNAVIALKSKVEKIREQAQNIE